MIMLVLLHGSLASRSHHWTTQWLRIP